MKQLRFGSEILAPGYFEPERHLRPSVAIGVMSTGFWKPTMGANLAMLCMRSMLVCDVTLLQEDNSGLADGRNKLVIAAQKYDCDYLFTVDSDMTFPDIALLELLSHNAMIVGATYGSRQPPYQLHGKWSDSVTKKFSQEPTGVHKVEWIPDGFMLVNMKAFQDIEPPWYFETIDWMRRSAQNAVGMQSQDVNFCLAAQKAGIDVMCDFDLTFKIGHIGEMTVKGIRPKVSPITH